MSKLKHQLNKNIIRKNIYKENFFEKLIIKSFFCNFMINPKTRISFGQQNICELNTYNFFSTQQKLQCLISLSCKVSNKKFNFSRFFFNKQLDFLVVSNTLK